MFAECQNTSTRQRGHLPSADGATLGKHTAHSMAKVCRVPAVGKALALGISYLCRVPLGLHTAKAARVPAVRRPLGRLTAVILCRVLHSRHSAKATLRRVLYVGTRQSLFRRVPTIWHSANSLYIFFHSKFFILNSNMKS